MSPGGTWRAGARGRRRAAASGDVRGQWLAYRHDAAVAERATVRFGITLGFPEWRPW